MTEYELRAAIQALETEADGEPFTTAQKNRWNELNKQLDEYGIRRQRLAELAGDSRHVEGERPFLRGPRTDDLAPSHVRAAHDAGRVRQLHQHYWLCDRQRHPDLGRHRYHRHV